MSSLVDDFCWDLRGGFQGGVKSSSDLNVIRCWLSNVETTVFLLFYGQEHFEGVLVANRPRNLNADDKEYVGLLSFFYINFKFCNSETF